MTRPWTARAHERVFVLGAAAVLVGVSLPIILHGTPLADEYYLCQRPVLEGGYGKYLAQIWADTGVVRPARFVELFLVGELCHRVPFGLIIVVPLVVKLAVAALLLGLLRDLRLPAPWPGVGAALCLLEPLGTEAALWPAALHVNLGLLFALAALRLYARGYVVAGSLAAAAACLSVEQAIFGLPFATWLVTPTAHRRRATSGCAIACLAVLAAYAAWPGTNPRQHVPLARRAANMVKPTWYVVFAIVGLGLHSGAVAFVWALPWSVVLVAAATWAGWRYGSRLLAPPREIPPLASPWTAAIRLAMLLLLVNLPLIVTEVGYSPRTFTPTWLVLAAAAGFGGSHLRASSHQLTGALAGAFVAFAVLSLSLSVWVRLETIAFNQRALAWIAAHTHDGDVVAICNVERTAVEPAPSGAFHLHEFHDEYGGALLYQTGRRAEIRRSGQRYWGTSCPNLQGADLVVDFRELKAAAARGR